MSKEIRTKINALNLEAEGLFDPTTFVLNPRMVAIQNEIEALQAQCTHSFVNGVCEFCDRGETNE